jgi:hypothetical protein
VIAEPWPGIPIRKGNRKTRAADIAEGTWPDLLGTFKPHDDRHTQSTSYLSGLPKVIQMDRRGHAMQGMDSVYLHVTDEMRQRLCDYLEGIWRQGLAAPYAMAPRSAVPLLNEALIAHEARMAQETEEAQEQVTSGSNT